MPDTAIKLPTVTVAHPGVDYTDISGAVALAVAALPASGGRVILPAGEHFMNTTITVTKPVTFQGAGRREWVGAPGGTRILYNGAQPVFLFSTENARGGGVTDLIIDGQIGDESMGNVPTSGMMAFAIDTDTVSPLNGMITVFNVGLHRLAQGIRLYKAGRSHLDAIFGDPMLTGIQVEEAMDVIHMGRIHFWPFNYGYDKSEADATRPGPGTPTYDTKKYRQQSGRGIVLYRADGLVIESLFTFGYQIGVVLAAGGSAPVRDLTIKHFFSDLSMLGIHCTQTNATVNIHEMKHQAEKPIREVGEEVGARFTWGYPIHLAEGSSCYFVINHLHGEMCPVGWVGFGGSGHRVDIQTLSGDRMGMNCLGWGGTWYAFENNSPNAHWAFVNMHANNWDYGATNPRWASAANMIVHQGIWAAKGATDPV
ncbi:hypothetical protein EOD42_22505 [Rhodovarius crocodyli]|uniref:Pectate lyase superfamily protein domain-containing protein n=1 Tax=Rhodovarius crocodyli TaxID=1979269 RepID=A0A437M135_9PROT|nr:hypothetical protein [Rhodovarius crocodyli]RVT91430.1 hypothetical protein EOD42_22505 [Rhodovarius crocodyli]